ncbi:MAG: hypothetical protein H0X27_09225 [Caulobacteraceae bacterium]|nr:hypothetical protein [Caulobacteraceae bacterium]
MDDIEQLLADARRVIGYSARTGVLNSSDLVDAVLAVEGRRSSHTEPTAEEIRSLMSRLNAAVKAIYPITLIDLGSPWRPFGETKGRNVSRLVFAVLSAMIIATSGYYTWLYIQATDVLAGLTAIQEQNAVDKAERLYRSYQKNPNVISVGHPDSDDLHFEPYLRSYEELYAINNQMATYMPMALRLKAQATRIPLLSGLTALFKNKKSLGGGSAPDAKTVQTDYETAHRGAAYPDLNAPALSPNPAQASSPVAPVPGRPPAPIANAGTSEELAADRIRQNHISRTNFLTDEGMGVVAIETSQDEVSTPIGIPALISSCRSIIELYGVLILPALYGMIGTIVFELRKILNPLTPSASIERVIVRTALGGLAGISITFVFRPLHSAANDVTPSGIAVFGIAFILGFSIDVFFTLLDRMVGVVSQSIAGVNRTQGG